MQKNPTHCVLTAAPPPARARACSGRKGTDKGDQVEQLKFLAEKARGPAQRFEVLAQLVSSLFDTKTNMNDHLKTSVWKHCVNNMLEMMKILQVGGGEW